MVDKSRSGRRCSTTRFIATVCGDLLPGSKGTVRYEIENLGRQLIMVRWDAGFDVSAFLNEIVIDPETTVLHYEPNPATNHT